MLTSYEDFVEKMSRRKVNLRKAYFTKVKMKYFENTEHDANLIVREWFVTGVYMFDTDRIGGDTAEVTPTAGNRMNCLIEFVNHLIDGSILLGDVLHGKMAIIKHLESLDCRSRHRVMEDEDTD